MFPILGIPEIFKSVVRHLTHFKQMKKIRKVILKLPLEDKIFFWPSPNSNFLPSPNFEIWKIIILKFQSSKFQRISKFSQSFFRISKMEQAQKIAWFIQNYGYAIFEGFWTLPFLEKFEI